VASRPSARPVRIAGAGIAGLTAAFALAKRGFNVEVLEQNQRSGVRFGGDLQGIENWTEEEDALAFIARQGIELTFTATPPGESFVVLPDGSVLPIRFRHPPFYLVRRGGAPDDLDRALEAQARANPRIRLRYGEKVRDWASVDIVATGPDVRDVPVDGIVAGYTFDTAHPDLAVLLLDNNFAPAGYGYLLVRGGYGVVSTCCFRRVENALALRERCVEHLLGKFPAVRPANLRTYGGIANVFVPRRDPSGRAWIGEAGGFQDFLWGFGMRSAMASGALAAEAMATGQDFYRLAAQRLLPRVRASIGNRFLYQALGHRGYRWLATKLCRSHDPVRLLHAGYAPRWWNRLAYPLSRLVYARRLRDRRSFINEPVTV
jgi:flavin-dependent dehydrogenase